MEWLGDWISEQHAGPILYGVGSLLFGLWILSFESILKLLLPSVDEYLCILSKWRKRKPPLDENDRAVLWSTALVTGLVRAAIVLALGYVVGNALYLSNG